jgi:putative endonuclease
MSVVKPPGKSKKYIQEPTEKPHLRNNRYKGYYGRLGENLAVKHLQSIGYKIIRRNFRLKYGEIDIVAVKDSCLFFIEVKTRWSRKFGSPQEAVNARKLTRIRKIAEYYAAKNPDLPQRLRLQVVAIEILPNQAPSIKILEDY